jgi:site-specific recombinase XerD
MRLGANAEYTNKENLVFVSRKGTLLSRRNIQKTHKAILKRCNIEYRNFHAIRHSFVTRLFEKGVQAKIIQEIIGHADIATTLNIYAHVSRVMKHDAIEKLRDTPVVEEAMDYQNTWFKKLVAVSVAVPN